MTLSSSKATATLPLLVLLMVAAAALVCSSLVPATAWAKAATTEVTVPEDAITYTDEAGIVYYAGVNEDNATATLKLIVLDNATGTVVQIPQTITKDDKTYTINAIQHDHSWGHASDYSESGSNENIFGEEISYKDEESFAPVEGDARYTAYPSEKLASITSISIPATVTKIGGQTFNGCTGVVSYDFGVNSQLKSIGDQSFKFNVALTTINLPEALETIGSGYGNVFYGCTFESITIPASVKEISANGLSEMGNLTTCVFADGSQLEKLGANVFANDAQLTSANIPSTVKSIGALGEGTQLPLLDLTQYPDLEEIGGGAYWNRADVTSFECPSSVKSISADAFRGTSISTFVIPSEVTQINDVFGSTPALSEIVIGSGGNNVGTLTFAKWAIAGKNVKTVVFADNYNEIKANTQGFVTKPNSLKSLVFTGDVSGLTVTPAKFAKNMVGVTVYGYDEEDSESPLVKLCAGQNELTYKQLASIENIAISMQRTKYQKTGEPIIPDVVVTDGEVLLPNTGDESDPTNVDGYRLIAYDNVELGTATVTVLGTGKYSAIYKNLTFQITAEADKTVLDEAIADAEAAQAEAVASADGSDVAKDAKWVPEDVATALDDALAAAKEASEDDAATQAAVDEAHTALVEAVEAFRSAEKPGTMVDKTALNEAIEAASAIEQGKKTDEAKAALDAAITAAKAVAADASATEEQVADAVSALEAAVKAFNESADAVEPEPEPQPSPEPEPIVPATADTRLAGDTALDTMRAIVKAGFPSSDAVVVASLDGYWDALAASSLAGQAGCPVLMTDPSSLSGQTAAEIARLGAKKAYIAGGTMAVSDNVESQLKAKGLSVERLWGADAQVTAVKIAEALGSDHASTCVIATSGGYWDALSASPYAYVAKAPVFLTDSDGVLRADTLATIKAGGYTSAVIAGGTAAVDKSAEAALKGAGVSDVVRCGGKDAYETAVLLAKWEMAQGMGVSHIGVATSANGYWDALSGAALCGVNDSVIVLADEGATSAIDALIAPNAAEIEAVNVFGGTMAIGPGVDTAIAKALAGNAKLAAQSSAQLVAASLAA